MYFLIVDMYIYGVYKIVLYEYVEEGDINLKKRINFFYNLFCNDFVLKMVCFFKKLYLYCIMYYK